MSFNGLESAVLSYTDPRLAANEVTIEFWAWPEKSPSSEYGPVTFTSSLTHQFMTLLGIFTPYFADSDAHNGLNLEPHGAVTGEAYTWTYVVIQYNRTGFTMYLNGTRVYFYLDRFPVNDASQPQLYGQADFRQGPKDVLEIGGQSFYSWFRFTGYIDEVRVSRGLLYAGDTIPVPTALLPVERTTLALIRVGEMLPTTTPTTTTTTITTTTPGPCRSMNPPPLASVRIYLTWETTTYPSCLCSNGLLGGVLLSCTLNLMYYNGQHYPNGEYRDV
jgi:hypothetical protein